MNTTLIQSERHAYPFNAKHKNPMYRSMLMVGRSGWYAGEKVKVRRVRKGGK